MKKFRNIATAILFIAFTFFFLIVTIIREKGEASFHENRRLAEKPVISADYLADGTSVKQLDSYFTDHFAGRSHWLSLKAAIESKIGESIVNDVFIGENMLLDVSERNYSSLENTAAVVNKYADKYDGTVYFVAAPSSAGVYGDMLPEHLNVNTEKENIDKLYSMFDANVRKIDSYNILKMLNDNYIYYRNDSKWTSYGAYCVYRTVIQKLGFLPVAYDKYTIEHVSSEFRGNLYNKSQYAEIKADMIDVYNYNEGAEIISCTGYIGSGEWKEKSFMKKAFLRQTINTVCISELQRLLLKSKPM